MSSDLFLLGEPSFGRSGGACPARITHRPNGDNQEPVAGTAGPLFAGIQPGEYPKVRATAYERVFTRGEMFFIEGESVHLVLLITAGVVKISKVRERGAEIILRLAVPGEVLGVSALYSTGSHRATAQAFRDCRALCWDAPAFKTLVSRYPILQHNMMRILGERLLDIEERFGEVATDPVAPRVARQLMRLISTIGRPRGGAVEVDISREELAQMTGTTLYTVSRLLSAWKARGIVDPRRGSVAIYEIQPLRAISRQM
jgi:CRP-like cAMP-binding protein